MSGVRAASAPRRALLRWASRLLRREWRQQVRVLVLLTVVVATAVTVAAVAVEGGSTGDGRFGDASGLVRLEGGDAAAARIEQARARFGTVEVIGHRRVEVPSDVEPLEERDQDPAGPYGHGLLARRAGRYPAARGEVALTSGAAGRLGAAVGSQLTLGGEAVSVVGIVENPQRLSDEFVLVAPGALPAVDTYTLLVDATHTGTATEGGGVPFDLEVRGSQADAAAAVVLTATTLVLALVGLIAAAGFVVVAQRRQRQLGLLAAIGATDRQIRLVIMANGLIVGTVAAAVGSVLGIATWIVVTPAVESAADHRIGRLDLPWVLVGAIGAIAVFVATAAAWWPARIVSSLPVTTALSGRPPRPAPVHRSLAPALGLLVAGLVAIGLSGAATTQVHPWSLVGGLLAVVAGMVLLAPAAVRGAGGLARHLPLAPRLALRDLARHQARAAAAVAAVTLGLGLAAGVVGVAAANEHGALQGNLSDRELLIRVHDARAVPGPALDAGQVADLDRRASAVAAALGDDAAAAVPLDLAFPAAAPDGNLPEPVGIGVPTGDHTIESRGQPYVATPAVLAAYGIDPGSVPPGTDLLTSAELDVDPAVVFVDPSRRPDPAEVAPVSQRVDLPPYASAPHVLVTQEALDRHGWRAARVAWVVESPGPLTTAQIAAARDAAASAGLAVAVRDTQDHLAAIRDWATIAGAVVAVLIVAVAVGLIRGESAHDDRTMAATGAGGRVRRALAACTAAALATMGALLGLAGAYLALAASFRNDLGRLSPVPTGPLLCLGIGLPIVAAGACWLVAGGEPRSLARAARD